MKTSPYTATVFVAFSCNGSGISLISVAYHRLFPDEAKWRLLFSWHEMCSFCPLLFYETVLMFFVSVVFSGICVRRTFRNKIKNELPSIMLTLIHAEASAAAIPIKLCLPSQYPKISLLKTSSPPESIGIHVLPIPWMQFRNTIRNPRKKTKIPTINRYCPHSSSTGGSVTISDAILFPPKISTADSGIWIRIERSTPIRTPALILSYFCAP